jgi:twitching motility protein PilT
MARIDAFLEIGKQQGGSDIHFTVGLPPLVRLDADLLPIKYRELSQQECHDLVREILRDDQWAQFEQRGAVDLGYTAEGLGRFRINVCRHRTGLSTICRIIPDQVPLPAELGLPRVLSQFTRLANGLVLITGSTGTGKSTTLAAMLREINERESLNIITLEDPIEFIHPQKAATINQRELGSDFDLFASGLRAALRQAPNVILVGEMRDRTTVEIALNAAETGHLVFSTLHTIDSGQTINRIVGMFELEEQEQIRYRLADTLRWVISQRLVPRVEGGRFPLVEIMGANLRTKESIMLGESEGKSFYEIIEASYTFGWRTFDQAALEAFKDGIVTEDTALRYCSKRGHVSRGIDQIRHSRGEFVGSSADLRMTTPAPKSTPAGRGDSAPPTLKIK